MAPKQKQPSPSPEVPVVPLGATRPRHVAGLDHASGKFHLVCDNGFWHHLHLTDADGDADDRRQQLFECGRLAFSLLPHHTLIVAEDPIVTRNGRTTKILSLAAGAIWASHLTYPVMWVWCDSNSWKKDVCGKGNISKDEIPAWVEENLGMKFPEEEPDYADAACLMRWGQIKLGLV